MAQSVQDLMLTLKTDVEQLNFENGLMTLESNGKFSEGNHRLVYYLEKGSMLHYQG